METPMNSTQQTSISHWGKALAFAIAFLVILFLLFSKSSCSRNLEIAKNAKSQSGTTAARPDDNKPGDEQAPSETSSEDESQKMDENQTKSERKEPLGDSEANEYSPSANKPQNSQAGDASMARKSESSDAGAPATSGSNDAPGQSIGGLSVQGEKLGVILDVSGSMQRYLARLRSEIRVSFPDAEFREVEGCFLEPADPLFIPDHSTASRDSVMDAITELVQSHQIDSIYWFCDLQDERTEEAVRQLRAMSLGRNENQRGFRLYIRSTDELPDAGLEDIIRSSGGAFERSR